MLGEQAYQNALRRRDDLHREIDQRRAEVEQIDAFLNLCTRFAAMGEGTVEPSLPVAGVHLQRVSEDQRRRRFTTVSGMALLPHIRKAILEIGKPLRRGAIVEALDMRGIRVGGKGKPASNIGTVMWRASKDNGHFIGLPKGYWPRDIACPAMGYEPTAADMLADLGEPDPESEESIARTAQDQHSDVIGDEPIPSWEQAAKSV